MRVCGATEVEILLMSEPTTDFERALLDWIRERAEGEELRAQLASAEVVGREYTGVGAYLSLAVPEGVDRIELGGAKGDSSGPRRTVSGPELESPDLVHGGGSILFLEDGRLSFLELFAYGESFPNSLEAVSIK